MIYNIMENKEFKAYSKLIEDIQDTINELIRNEDETGGGYSLKEKERIMKLNLKFEVFDYNY